MEELNALHVLLAGSAAEVVAVCRSGGEDLHVHERAAERLGDIAGRARTLWQLFPPDEVDLARALADEALEAGASAGFVDLVRVGGEAADEPRLPVYAELHLLEPPTGGSFLGLVARALESIHAQRLVGQAGSPGTVFGRWSLDQRDGRLRLDGHAARLLGLGASSWVGDPAALDLTTSDEAPDAAVDAGEESPASPLAPALQQAARRATSWTAVVRLDAPGPSPRWLQLRGGPMGGPLFGGIVLDVSEERRAQWLLQALVEGLTPDTMGAVDTDMRYIALNSGSRDRLQAIYGTTYEVGDSALSGMSSEMAEASAAVWGRALDGESWTDEFTFGDRSSLTFRSRFYPLRDASGEILGAAGWGTDITEAARAKQELEDANEALEQFVYMASHDLRAPLRGVSTYARILRQSVTAGDTERMAATLDLIDGQVAQMGALISDLLTWAEVRKVDTSDEEVDLDPVVSEVLARLSPQLAQTSARVQRGRFGTCAGHRRTLAEAIYNLVENALKYHGEAPPEVSITQVDEPVPAVVVADNGIGIEPAQHDRIFEFFQRLHGPSAYGGGTGAGLAIAREIAHQHGGDVTVASTPGAGTTFTMTLPTLRPLSPGADQR